MISPYLIWILSMATQPECPVACPEPAPVTAVESAAFSQWEASTTDNICGLRDLEQLSKPAQINYERCLKATPEMKRIKKEGIRPQSPEGIQLKSEAVDRVAKAANLVREAGGFCSVWKAITHKEGKRVPDLTSRVIGQY